MSRISPMMEQYKAIKEQHPDKLLMFQVGDFYEFFFEDAEIAAREMEIALTSRDAGSDNPVPLSGVPIHAAETYLNKLLGKGYKVVICEQVENARLAKGLVRREITRILTPGTIIDPEMLEENRNNYLVTLVSENNNYFGLAAVDVSTGVFQVTEQKGESSWDIIADELQRLQPTELICSTPALEGLCRNLFQAGSGRLIDLFQQVPSSREAKEVIAGQWDDNSWNLLKLDLYPMAARAAAMAITYLHLLRQLPQENSHFHKLELYFAGRSMILDCITSRNLELTQSIRGGVRQDSLLGLLDRCQTAMGRRLLRRWVEQPLIQRQLIEKRLEAVAEFLSRPLQRRDLRKTLQEMFDLERFCSRLSYERINARDLIALKRTLLKTQAAVNQLGGFSASLLVELVDSMPAFDNLIDIIDRALVDDPPLTLKEGGLFKTGYNVETDRLKKISTEANSLLLDFEKKERSRTGIKSLRVGYNRNFGYYLEVTRTNLDLIPPEYHRKQTLVNAERFTTEELYRMEEQITGARDKLANLEFELFEELRRAVSKYTPALLNASYLLAVIDCIQSLSEVAERNDYCRPVFSGNYNFSVKQARHPVVERLAGERFVPNDIKMDRGHFLLVITGPNMAGKSTYIRSAALIAVMAQLGSFVPAKEAELPILDRLFARVGASDDLSRGHSTFMVEMQETAAILKEATPNSLIILDEIGRGTSTYDGMSIARSVLEYISAKIKAKTLFSTHYHELTNLEDELPGIRNYTIAVKEKGREVVFLRQVLPGRADKSYGINVARLAGVPVEVLIRAEKILTELELASQTAAEQQLSLLPMVSISSADHRYALEVVEQVKELDLNRITPLEALQRLFEFQQLLLENEQSEDKEGDE